MQKLFQFLYQYRAFFFLVLLEVACGYLIVKNNRYQSAAFFNSSNEIAGTVLSTSNEVYSYFSLKDVNHSLATENALLRSQLENLADIDTSAISYKNNLKIPKQYEFLPAEVINNSVNRYNNYLTINKGSSDGMEHGMGVICPEGVVGKIKSVSKHYSTITSLLHTDGFVSAVIKNSDVFGSLKWEGKDAKTASLLFVPRHIQVEIGDTVMSSGYNAIYPKGILIGIIKSVDIKGNEAFYDIELELSTDFSKLAYVYVVRNNLKQERDSLEAALQ